jgi:hypothetical protein
MSIFFNKAIFDLQVAVLKLILSKTDMGTQKELEDASHLDSLPRERRRQVIRNIDKAIELLDKRST